MNPGLPTSTHASDQQLIDDYAKTQSAQAFQAIVDRHARWIFAAAYRQLRDRQLAEDAAQTVFILLIQRSSSMKTHEKLSGWLFSTLQYTVKNIQRVVRRRQARERLAALERVELAVSSESHASELHEQLDAAVARLSGVDRSAILLRYYQDLSFEQIAVTLNISEAAARKRVTRAVDGLRQRLGADVTSASLSVASGFGLAHTPANLTQTIAHFALGAKAGAALPAGLLSTTKGTVKLMIAAKLKIAALIAIGLAVSIPVAVVAVETTTGGQSAAPAPAGGASAVVAADSPAAADAPDWMAEFRKIYSLGPDQVVKNVPPPFADVRQQFMDEQTKRTQARVAAATQAARANGTLPNGMGTPSTLPSGQIVGSNGGMVMYSGVPSTNPSAGAMPPPPPGSVGTVITGPMVVRGGAGGGRGVGGGFGGAGMVITGGGAGKLMAALNGPADAALLGQNGAAFDMLYTSPPSRATTNKGFSTALLAQFIVGVPYDTVDGDKSLLQQIVPGDFVMKETATQEQLRAGLEKLLSDQLGEPVTLTFRDAQVSMYVFSGTWNYKPVDTFEAGAKPVINIYDTDMEDKSGYGMGHGGVTGLANMIGQFTNNAKVMFDAQGIPDTLDYKTHYDGMASKRNVEAVLNHISEQTGLTWKKEIRPVKHLFVEKAQ